MIITIATITSTTITTITAESIKMTQQIINNNIE